MPLSPVGRQEYAALPLLGVVAVEAKIDTGAVHCVLQASDVEILEPQGSGLVSFNVGNVKVCAPIVGWSRTRTSTGAQFRPFIRTRVKVGEVSAVVKVSLCDRRKARVNCDMLIGLNFLSGRCLVVPNQKHMHGSVVKAVVAKKK
jgi:ribosomal protein S6--L-glutamate ligase